MYAGLLLSLLLLHVCALSANTSSGKATVPTVEDHVGLEKHLMELGRNWTLFMQSILPRSTDEKPVNVTLGMSLLNFNVDMDKDKLYVNTWITEKWKDYRMTWNPKDYGGITVARVFYYTLWRSDLSFLSGYGPTNMNQVSPESRGLLNHDGNVQLFHHLGLESLCRFDREDDDAVQTCTLRFGSWAYDATQIDYHQDSDYIDLSLYSIDPKWTIIDTKAERRVKHYTFLKEPYVEVHFVMNFRKRVPEDHFDVNNEVIANRQG